jgi:hypothetical protein
MGKVAGSLFVGDEDGNIVVREAGHSEAIDDSHGFGRIGNAENGLGHCASPERLPECSII